MIMPALKYNEDNVTSLKSLTNRLNLNAKYSKFDFHSWVRKSYCLIPGMDILDVGCGNGAQIFDFINIIGSDGSISGLDISKESIEEIKQKSVKYKNIDVIADDMNNLKNIIKNQFKIKRYDLAHATYALAYAADPIGILDSMRLSLKKTGRLIITSPIDPNSLRELAKKLGKPLPKYDSIGRFPKEILEPYFRSYFYNVKIEITKNVLAITNSEDVINFYRNTGYHDSEIEIEITKYAKLEIERKGFFGFEKNNFMIIGENQIF